MTKKKSSYFELLKDPRWQKKRLEILERDQWACRSCFNTVQTLHVHHIRYVHNTNPWDTPNEMLITLCESCHEDEQERSEWEGYLLEALKDSGLMVRQIEQLVGMIREKSIKFL